MTKILLVDDEPEVIEEFAVYLRRRGFEVHSHNNAVDALRSFRNRRPDVVLSDYKMPDICGLELLRECKTIDSDVPVILMSGAADARTALELLKSEAFDFLRKPIDSRELLDTINAARARVLESRKNDADSVRSYGPVAHSKLPRDFDVSMVQVMGPLDERTRKRLEKAFRKLFEEEQLSRHIILTFKHVTYINNVGMNFLIELAGKLKERGHVFVCTQLSEKLYQYLNMLGYLDYFHAVLDLEEAVQLLQRMDEPKPANSN